MEFFSRNIDIALIIASCIKLSFELFNDHALVTCLCTYMDLNKLCLKQYMVKILRQRETHRGVSVIYYYYYHLT